MFITLLSTSGVAFWLWSRRSAEPALVALAIFCQMMGVWCLGHIAANYSYALWASILVLSGPLIPTAFLHFLVTWLKDPLNLPAFSLRFFSLFYSTAILVCLASVLVDGAFIAPWLKFPGFVHLNVAGWLNLAYTAFIGVVAHLLLLQALLKSRGNLRSSVIAIFLVGAWGFCLAANFLAPSIGVAVFPYAMLALPSYPVLLVYAVVRYRIVEVNRWVSRAVLWLGILTASMLIMSIFLALLAPLGMEQLKQVPTLQLFVYSAVLLLMAALLYGPVKQFSDRLVYTGLVLNQSTLDSWVTKLNRVQSWQELAQTAEKLWYDYSLWPAKVYIEHDASLDDEMSVSMAGSWFLCQKAKPALSESLQSSRWYCERLNWQQATPAQQHLSEFMATLLPSACAALERSLQLAQAQEEQLKQQHLIELGGLTAAIAHELRNPLNIITMAATQTDPVIRAHIQNQVQRAELLVKDVLTYSGQLVLQTELVPIRPLVDQVRQQIQQLFQVNIEMHLSDTCMAYIDSERIQQVFINLLENAAAFVPKNASGLIVVEEIVERSVAHDKVVLAVHNNGPSIAVDMHQRLFQAFISKRSGGSGLGLAIVQRIMKAHHGDVYHSDAYDWPVSFIVELPIHRRRDTP